MTTGRRKRRGGARGRESLRLGEVLRLTPALDALPPGARVCRAAYCSDFAGHAGRHSALHYLLLDGEGVPNPAHAVCSCHPSGQ